MGKILKYHHLWIMLTPTGTTGLSSPILKLAPYSKQRGVLLFHMLIQRWSPGDGANECTEAQSTSCPRPPPGTAMLSVAPQHSSDESRWRLAFGGGCE